MPREFEPSPELEEAAKKASEEGEEVAETYKREKAEGETDPIVKNLEDTMQSIRELAEKRLHFFDEPEKKKPTETQTAEVAGLNVS